MSHYTYVHILDKSLHLAIVQLFLAAICLGSANGTGAKVVDKTSYQNAVSALALYLLLGFFWMVVTAAILYVKYGKRGLIVGLGTSFVFYYLLWSMYAYTISQAPGAINSNSPSIERLNYVTQGDVLNNRIRPSDRAKLQERMGAVSGTNSHDAYRSTMNTSVADNLSSVGPVDGSVLPGEGNWFNYLHNGTATLIEDDVNPANYNMNLNFPLETVNSPDPDFAVVTGGQGFL